MKIIALSGGISSGKNFISDIFVEFGAVVFDADKVVHELFEGDDFLFERVTSEFGDAIENGKINREILGEIVFANIDKLHILEKIIHPLVRKKYQEFLRDAVAKEVDFVLLNIPLLLEKGGYEYDYLIAIVTDFELRKERFLARELAKTDHDRDFLAKKFDKIVAKQISDEDRVLQADFVFDGALAKSELCDEVRLVLEKIR